jgi:hypothetical protein
VDKAKVYYPQASLLLNILWEDFGDKQSAKLKQVYGLPILARRVSVNINDYTQADTFEAEIDFKNFPFDPRCIRACGVSVFMEDMGELFKTTNNGLNQIVPSDANKIFIGYADEESISFDDTKRTVRLEGRDQTCLFIDRKYLKGTLPVENTLDVVLQQILDELPENQQASELGKIKLDNRIEEPLPVLSSFWGEKDKLSGQKNIKRDQTYWDVIQSLVGDAGLIAYIELDKLVLSTPRLLYDKKAAKRFIYGKNIGNLEFKRKLGRRRNFNLIVRSLNLETKEVIAARIPADATEEWSTATGIANTEVKVPEIKPDGSPVDEKDAKPATYIAFRVANVTNKDQLVKIGQEVYEEMGRQQIEGSFETNDMDLCVKENGKETQSSILSLRNGTPVSIDIDQGDLEGISRIKSVSERVRFLRSRLYDPKIAEVFAETMGRVATPFYTKSVNYSMDAQSGFKCKVDFVNFIEITNKAFGGKP